MSNRAGFVWGRAAAAVAVVLVAGAVMISATIGPAFAHQPRTHWPQQTVVVRDETGVADFRRAIDFAVRRWNAAGANIRFELRNGTGRGCSAPTPGEVSVCRQELESSTVGLARVWVSEGHIVKAAVLMDASPRPFEHLVAIACHELGHALGLDHRSEQSSCLTTRIHSADPDEHDRGDLRRSHDHTHATTNKEAPESAPKTCSSSLLRIGSGCYVSLDGLMHRD